MTKFSKISLDEVSENQVLRSNVAKTQQPDAEGLTAKNFQNISYLCKLHHRKTVLENFRKFISQERYFRILI